MSTHTGSTAAEVPGTTTPLLPLNDLYEYATVVPLIHADFVTRTTCRARNANQLPSKRVITLLMEQNKRRKEGTNDPNLHSVIR